MNDKKKVLEDYKKANSPLPDINWGWSMYGQGIENVGKDNAPVKLPIPEICDDQLLVRVDAVGLCFSDIKLITQGNEHPRIFGRDLQKEPVVPGHEAVMTVVKIGNSLKSEYQVGQRFLIQADVFYQGKSMAFGYVLPGALQQYIAIGPEILDGDEGNYLLQLRDEDGYAEVALSEPWACVVAAYRITPRETLKANGNALFVITGEERSDYTIKGAFAPEGKPQNVVILADPGLARDNLLRELGDLAKIAANVSVDELSQIHTKTEGFDDIVFLGTPTPEMVEACVKVLAVGGVMALLAEKPLARNVAIDIGRVHYDDHIYTGGITNSVAEAYKQRRDAKLVEGGNTWMIGAGGPMGQMHTQMAAEDPKGPGLLVVTEKMPERLAELENRFGSAAKARGARLVGFSLQHEGEEQVSAKIRETLAGSLFDDIVVNAPAASVVEDSTRWLKLGGILNIFAGVPRGTIGMLDLSKVYLEGQRWIGSSGSSLADLNYTLKQIQTKTLRTDRSVAAISGLHAAGEGLHGVAIGSYPGKIVVFPQLLDLPLISLSELEEHLPNVAAKLSSDGYWTKEAEDELFSSQIAQN